MTAPDYRLPQYGLTRGQLEQIGRFRKLPLWERRKLNKHSSGGPHGTFIYKYMGFDPDSSFSLKKVRDIVVDSKLYLSAPSDFNDPYDFRARITISTDAVRKRAHVEKVARRFLREGRDIAPGIRGTNRKIEAFVRQGMEEISPDRLHAAFEGTRDKNGVTCFSEDPRGLLMWAHYAFGHTGVCLQFDVTKDPGVLMISHRVAYRDQLPIVEWPDFENIVENVMLNKSRAWESEREVRYVSLTTVRNSLSFDGNALTAIILGSRFSSNQLSAIDRLLKDRVQAGLAMPIVYKAHQKPTEYGIQVKRLQL